MWGSMMSPGLFSGSRGFLGKNTFALSGIFFFFFNKAEKRKRKNSLLFIISGCSEKVSYKVDNFAISMAKKM